jgi:hypothetical protein
MNKNYRRILNLLKRIYRTQNPVNHTFAFSYEDASIVRQQASDLIKTKLLSDEPVMICRFGSTELNCVLTYYFASQNRSLFGKATDYFRGVTNPFQWKDETINAMCNNAGFFPPSIELLEKFSKLMLEDMKLVDVLGTCLKNEKLLSHYLSNAVKVPLPDIEPYYHQNPWTDALEGKTVLVIHPYEESITKQYAKRKHLFKDKRILPDFELKTIKAVQSIANSKTEFETWFDAYDHMCNQISNTNFDVAIIGCGAYGFPLSAHVKRVGRKAVQMGGPTQIMFGIKGKRWEEHPFISTLINEHWVRPSQSETPFNYSKVEDGCYW